MSIDEGTIETFKGKACCKSLFLTRQLLLFSALANYDLSWFRPLLRSNSPTFSCLILKMNMCYKGVSRELEKFTW
jgi:hypothetical protein